MERDKDDGSMSMQDEGPDEGLEAAGTDLLRAINAKNPKAIAAALRAAFEILDSMPHVEGEHLEEDSE